MVLALSSALVVAILLALHRNFTSQRYNMIDSLAARRVLAATVLALLLPVLTSAQNVASSPYVASGATGSVHIYPTPAYSRQIEAQRSPAVAPGVLSYNCGPIMTGNNFYAIFWIPSTLQNGNPTSLTAKYQSVAKQFLADYPYHGISNNSTQYYSQPVTTPCAGTKTYWKGPGGLSASYVDTNPYPASGCSDSVTPGNCITDAQLQTEIQAVMTLKGWTGGFNKIFIVFTSTGEGSCFDSTSSSCAYTQYCAYHGNFGSTTIPVIYANMPYANPSYCYSSSSGQHDPSGDIPSDANVNVTSHEITEANTDPLVAAGPFGWYDTANGEEIGDLCAWQFGTADWDGGLANQMWNGHFYDLQLEYDNHTSTCVKLGP